MPSVNPLSIGTFLLGFFLGLNFKVLIVIPASVLVVLAIATIGLTIEQSLSWIVTRAMLNVAILHVGYLIGVTAGSLGNDS